MQVIKSNPVCRFVIRFRGIFACTLVALYYQLWIKLTRYGVNSWDKFDSQSIIEILGVVGIGFYTGFSADKSPEKVVIALNKSSLIRNNPFLWQFATLSLLFIPILLGSIMGYFSYSVTSLILKSLFGVFVLLFIFSVCLFRRFFYVYSFRLIGNASGKYLISFLFIYVFVLFCGISFLFELSMSYFDGHVLGLTHLKESITVVMAFLICSTVVFLIAIEK
ncbi:hypothetical protein D0S45_10365 [Marinifilum sp. JC120]|nr:hypothetical protein D0S45_10365 [Marinifilum sp. JC120]